MNEALYTYTRSGMIPNRPLHLTLTPAMLGTQTLAAAHPLGCQSDTTRRLSEVKEHLQCGQ